MKHSILIDGQERVIDIRPMDERFIVYRKMYAPPLTPGNIDVIAPHDHAGYMRRFQREGWFGLIDGFLRKQIRTIGSCAILAWDVDGVIGKMRFTTREMYDAFRQVGAWPCVEHESMPRTIHSLAEEELQRLLASESRTLFITCLNVGHFDTRYHGQGLASTMLECLKQWARKHGWPRLECPSCPDVVPFRALGPQVMRRGWLEERGFHVARQTRVSSEEAALRRQAIVKILADELDPEAWDVRSYPSNVRKVKELASHMEWTTDCDVDYVMACGL